MDVAERGEVEVGVAGAVVERGGEDMGERGEGDVGEREAGDEEGREEGAVTKGGESEAVGVAVATTGVPRTWRTRWTSRISREPSLPWSSSYISPFTSRGRERERD